MMQEITNTALKAKDVYPKFKVKDEAKEFSIFLTEMKYSALIVTKRLGKNFEFVVDDQNKKIISQFWYYITNSPKFIGDHQKGIFLSGDIGTGKTILMLSFLETMKRQNEKNYTVTFPETVHKFYNDKGQNFFMYRPLLIDDICREPEKVEGYWGENPIKLITMFRYNYPNQNYCTGNFTVFDNSGNVKPDNKIAKRYGVMIFDRIWETYNFIELKGESRR